MNQPLHLLIKQQHEQRKDAAEEDRSCGESTHRSISLPDCHDNHCERTFVQYIPSLACHNTTSGVLPLVFVVHCLGCNSGTMMHWIDVAEAYGFMLVIPEGIHSSFNALQSSCCGYALENNLDDVGFFQAIITELSTTTTAAAAAAAAAESIVSPDVIYGVGWSNGGYMVVSAAHLFRAIAPISGYQIASDLLPSKPTGIFLHHAQDDPFVQITGCCTDPSMPKCCCRISATPGFTPSQCTSAQDKFQEWSTQVNHCSSSSTTTTTTIVDTSTNSANNNDEIVCTSMNDCKANTTFCRHSSGGHFNQPSFKNAFPMTIEIADFFAKDACSIHGGNWDAHERTCSCSSTATGGGATKQGTYCLAGGVNDNGNNLNQQQQSAENPTGERTKDPSMPQARLLLLIVGAAGAIFVALLFAKRFKSRRQRYVGFQKISTTEVELRDM